MSNTLTVASYITTNRQSINPKSITISEWCLRWLAYYSIGIKETTLSSYKSAIENHISRVIGKYRLNEVSAELLQLFYNSLHEGIGIKKPLSPKTIRNIHGVLHKSLQIAVSFEYIPKNPANLVVLPKKEKKIIRPLNNEQIKLFLQSAQTSPYFNVFFFALFTGMRQSEIIGLTWDCVDFNNKTVRVEKQFAKVKGVGFKFLSCKNSRERLIKPADIVFDVLAKEKQSNKSRFVFVNPKGEHLTQSGIYNSYKRLMRKNGMENFRFHDLRHTYAVICLQARDDYKTLQYNMGHYSAAFTLDTYGFCTELMKTESSKRIQSYYTEKFALSL